MSIWMILRMARNHIADPVPDYGFPHSQLRQDHEAGPAETAWHVTYSLAGYPTDCAKSTRCPDRSLKSLTVFSLSQLWNQAANPCEAANR